MGSLRAKRLLRLGLAVGLSLVPSVLLTAPLAIAAPPVPCSATAVIAVTGFGAISQTGQVERGQATVAGTGSFVIGGVPVGAVPVAGVQDVTRNLKTQKAQLKGQLVASPPGGTITVEAVAHLDTAAGTGSGHGNITGGTGTFAGLRGSGSYAAARIPPSPAPVTYEITINGRCHLAS